MGSEIQEEVEQLAMILNDIRNPHAMNVPSVAVVLTKTEASLAELKSLLERKIQTQTGGRPRARQRAWARYRSEVYTIQKSLKEHRASLALALAAKTAWVLHPCRSASLIESLSAALLPNRQRRSQQSAVQSGILQTHPLACVQCSPLYKIPFGRLTMPSRIKRLR